MCVPFIKISTPSEAYYLRHVKRENKQETHHWIGIHERDVTYIGLSAYLRVSIDIH